MVLLTAALVTFFGFYRVAARVTRRLSRSATLLVAVAAMALSLGGTSAHLMVVENLPAASAMSGALVGFAGLVVLLYGTKLYFRVNGGRRPVKGLAGR